MMKTVYVKRIFAIIAIFILSFSLFTIGCGSDTPEYPILKWRTDGLYGILPPPTVEYGKIVSDSESTLEFTMYGVDKKAFSTYVQLCSEKGFTHNVVNTNEFFYSVTNAQGYKISMQYVKTAKELNVTLDATGVIVKVGRPSEDFRGLMYTDVADMMKALGFINVQTQVVSVSASSNASCISRSLARYSSYFSAVSRMSECSLE